MFGSKFSNRVRPTTLRVNVRGCAILLVWLVNHTVEFVLPSGKLVATELTSTETVALPPPARVPLVGETVNQLAVLDRAQLNAFVPAFSSVKEAGFGINGPPTGPLEDNAVGLICKSSGTS